MILLLKIIMRIIISTNNQNKIKEFKNIIKDEKYNIFSLKDLNININSIENGNSFNENSYIKVSDLKNYMIKNKLLLENDILIADDSGLCIDKLNGNPGINSARFMGENTDFNIKNNEILKLLLEYKKIEDRTAYFISVICAYINNSFYYFEGKMQGYINFSISGNNGFGYDPIFFIKEYNKNVAELDISVKNNISHRYKAINKLLDFLNNYSFINK